jgi:hypothetical protein
MITGVTTMVDWISHAPEPEVEGAVHVAIFVGRWLKKRAAAQRCTSVSLRLLVARNVGAQMAARRSNFWRGNCIANPCLVQLPNEVHTGCTQLP